MNIAPVHIRAIVNFLPPESFGTVHSVSKNWNNGAGFCQVYKNFFTLYNFSVVGHRPFLQQIKEISKNTQLFFSSFEASLPLVELRFHSCLPYIDVLLSQVKEPNEAKAKFLRAMAKVYHHSFIRLSDKEAFHILRAERDPELRIKAQFLLGILRAERRISEKMLPTNEALFYLEKTTTVDSYCYKVLLHINHKEIKKSRDFFDKMYRKLNEFRKHSKAILMQALLIISDVISTDRSDHEKSYKSLTAVMNDPKTLPSDLETARLQIAILQFNRDINKIITNGEVFEYFQTVIDCRHSHEKDKIRAQFYQALLEISQRNSLIPPFKLTFDELCMQLESVALNPQAPINYRIKSELYLIQLLIPAMESELTVYRLSSTEDLRMNKKYDQISFNLQKTIASKHTMNSDRLKAILFQAIYDYHFLSPTPERNQQIFFDLQHVAQHPKTSKLLQLEAEAYQGFMRRRARTPAITYAS